MIETDGNSNPGTVAKRKWILRNGWLLKPDSDVVMNQLRANQLTETNVSQKNVSLSSDIFFYWTSQ